MEQRRVDGARFVLYMHRIDRVTGRQVAQRHRTSRCSALSEQLLKRAASAAPSHYTTARLHGQRRRERRAGGAQRRIGRGRRVGKRRRFMELLQHPLLAAVDGRAGTLEPGVDVDIGPLISYVLHRHSG